jgi:prepilin-type N-terminal cleavage/methylation domain-containing protein
MRPKAARGFTLIELLISVALMVLVLASVTLVFSGTTETVAIQGARMTVYTNARYAMDVLENDLLGCLPFNPPSVGLAQAAAPGQPLQLMSLPHVHQAFWMENGVLREPGQPPVYNVSGGHTDAAGDRLSFRATTAVGDTLQTCQVTYELIPGNMTLNEQGLAVPGDPNRLKTARTGRGLYTLVRRVRVAKPESPNTFSEFAVVKDRVSGRSVKVLDQDLCQYVVSFNLEYYASNQLFSQLDPTPFPSGDPLGDGKGVNDTTTPFRVPSIRATLVIVEDVGERQERTIQRVFRIPQG